MGNIHEFIQGYHRNTDGTLQLVCNPDDEAWQLGEYTNLNQYDMFGKFLDKCYQWEDSITANVQGRQVTLSVPLKSLYNYFGTDDGTKLTVAQNDQVSVQYSWDNGRTWHSTDYFDSEDTAHGGVGGVWGVRPPGPYEPGRADHVLIRYSQPTQLVSIAVGGIIKGQWRGVTLYTGMDSNSGLYVTRGLYNGIVLSQ